MAKHRADLAAVLALWILATIALWPFVRGGESLAGFDLADQYLPYRHVANEAMRAGEMPWWNPLHFCGMSAVGNLNLAFFYPPNFLSLLVPLHRWFSITVWLHVLWGLLGCHLVHRRIGLGVVGAFAGSMVFWASGFFLFNLYSGVILFHQAGAWFPWAMLGVVAFARSGDKRWLALWSVSLALMFLAGAPQIAYFAGLTSGLAALTLLVGQRRLLQNLGWLAFAAWAAGMLVQIQYQPAREVSAMSQRATLEGAEEYDQKTRDSLTERCLLLALMPNLCGDLREDTQWGTVRGHHEVVPAVLPPALWLFLVGIFGGRPYQSEDRTRRRWWWLNLILGGVALWASFGVNSPLFRLLWVALPGLSEFRVPGRLNLITLWCFSSLAAMAAQDWSNAIFRETDPTAKRRWLVGGIFVACLGITVGVLSQVVDPMTLAIMIGLPPELLPEGLPFAQHRLMLMTHFERHPELIGHMGYALLLFSLLTTLSGIGIALAGAPRRLAPAGIGLVAMASIIAVIPLRHLGTLPSDEFHDLLYTESPLITRIQEEIGDGRILLHDSAIFDPMHPELRYNRLMMHGIPTVRGYDPLVRNDLAVWMNTLTGVPPDFPARGRLTFTRIAEPELLAQLDAALILSREPMDHSVLEEIPSGATGMHLYRILNSRGPAWLLTEGEIDEPEEPPHFRFPLYSPRTRKAGMLVMGVSADSGWWARRGVVTVPARNLGPWIAADLPAGGASVFLIYRPPGLDAGAVLSVGGFLILLGLFSRNKRKGASEEAPGETQS